MTEDRDRSEARGSARYGVAMILAILFALFLWAAAPAVADDDDDDDRWGKKEREDASSKRSSDDDDDDDDEGDDKDDDEGDDDDDDGSYSWTVNPELYLLWGRFWSLLYDDDYSGELNPTNAALTGMDLLSVTPTDVDELLETADAHKTATGHGAVVAVLDGGFNLDHPDLEDRVLESLALDALDLDLDVEDLGNDTDDDGDGIVDFGAGHGTFVAGMVLLAAPDAMILPVRVADDEGQVEDDAVALGIRYAVDAGADIINLSLELDKLGSGARSALKHAKKHGVLVVVSAGNDGSSKTKKLAEADTTLAVAATDAADEIASFSNYSEKLAGSLVCAPGVDLLGPVGYPTDSGMAIWSGTSFAAGLVSGAAAVALECNPSFDGGDLKELLLEEVDPVTHADGSTASNTGRINLVKIVDH